MPVNKHLVDASAAMFRAHGGCIVPDGGPSAELNLRSGSGGSLLLFGTDRDSTEIVVHGAHLRELAAILLGAADALDEFQGTKARDAA